MPGKKFIRITLQAILLSIVFFLVEAAQAAPFDQVIESAKKEGTVLVKLRSSFTPKSMERMEKEIKEKFGVGLKIQFSPSSSMSRALAESIMENKVGAPPSFDLMNFSNHVIDGMKLGILERVDWQPLITKDTNPEVVMNHPAFRGAITYYTSYQGFEKGVPTKWQCIELGETQNFSLSVRKGALHPNAAKLVAVYLASPQGARFTLEESNAGNLFYPDNYENDIRMQNKKQGIRDVFIDRNPQIIDFYTSKEFEKWEKEVDMIMKMGG